ncbi:FKBP-type peptidyl-prolyl cis-trans isomerase [Erythrobacteraceae bacterium E2-1 Yellow Sea]|nr:FKBP-type peptidyl-prolyl cis-trans isomerase [Erythrobacteraceae bacterium E2-1 Yellow Sea]
MTEITRVPLQPIEKGSLTKLWLAIILAILIGASIAWAAVPQGVKLDTLIAGEGPTPGAEDVVFVKYVGKLDDGTVFDQSQDLPLPVQGIFPEGNPLPLDQMVAGFRDGAMQMQKGGKYELFIPADQGYGATPPPGAPIPPNADLTFEVELVDFMSRDDFQRRIGLLQQAMGQAQVEAQGAPQP